MEKPNMNGTVDLLVKAQLAKAAGATVEIVGQWVWASFEHKPPQETRDRLLVEGYHWNAKRRVWQFAGIPCRYSPASDGEIKAKYGVQELEKATA